METTGNSQHSAKGHHMIESLNHFQKPNHTFTHTPYHLYPVFCNVNKEIKIQNVLSPGKKMQYESGIAVFLLTMVGGHSEAAAAVCHFALSNNSLD